MNVAIDYTSSIFIEDYVNEKADEVIINRFDDLAVFISDNGDLNEYDKLFKSMMNQETEACKNAYHFIFEQALKMIKSELKNKNEIHDQAISV